LVFVSLKLRFIGGKAKTVRSADLLSSSS
jgi:hypothetical protein